MALVQIVTAGYVAVALTSFTNMTKVRHSASENIKLRYQT